MNQGKPELCYESDKTNDPRELAFWVLKSVILSQELQNFFVPGSPLLNTNFNRNASLSTPEFMENCQGEMVVDTIYFSWALYRGGQPVRLHTLTLTPYMILIL